MSSRTKYRRQHPSPNGSMVHPRRPLRSRLLPRSRKASRQDPRLMDHSSRPNILSRRPYSSSRPPPSLHLLDLLFFFFSVLIIAIGMDTSFPSAAMIFAGAVPQKYQGMASSIVTTVVNYSISLSLGFSGTLETNINNGGLTKADKCKGYQGALWLSVGLAGLGFVLSLIYVYKDGRKTKAIASAKPHIEVEGAKE